MSIVSLRTLTRRTVSEAIAFLAGQSIDGLIVIAPQRKAVEALTAVPRDLPTVALEGGRAPGLPVVCVDQAAGAAAVTNYLLDLGHPTVWFVSGPLDWLEAEARLTAWRAALRAAGARAPEVTYGDWSPRSGYAAGRTLARRFFEQGDVSAVFVANDQMALGLLKVFRERGIDVPGGISVAGFDDVPEAEFFAPPLTTVRQDFGAVGRACIAVLLDQINGARARTDQHVIVPASLVPRTSTAGPKRS